MKAVPTVWTRLAQALLVAVLALNVYRAATCSITIDEAITYNRFVSPPLDKILAFYDANHHILYSQMAKASVSVFGLSEITLRLPSLLGGALYLWAAFALSRMIFGRRPMLVVAVALLGLNPLVLDYLSLARGYGPAMAFWLWGLYKMLDWLPSPSPRELRILAVALAVSVGFNLIFVFPGAVLAAWFVVVVWRERGSVEALVNHFLIPGVVTTFLILVLPLSRAVRGNFYLGTETVWEALNLLSRASLVADARFEPGLIRDWDVGLWILSPWMSGAAAGVLLWGTVAAGLLVRRWLRSRRFLDLTQVERMIALLAGTSLATLLVSIMAHILFYLPYPYGRTGIYWIPLLTLLGLALLERFTSNAAPRAAGGAAACACLLLYARQLHGDHYPTFVDDAGTKQIAEVLLRMETGQRKVRLGASWQLAEDFNFYRVMHRLTWLEPVELDSLGKPADYYVLLPADAATLETRKLRTIFRHPLSRAMLAK
jgi:hypothetical protein